MTAPRFFAPLFAAVAVVTISMMAPAAQAASSEPQKFVESVGNQALAIISSKSTKEQKQSKLEKLFSGNVDIAWVGKFVMGRYWRQASDAQKKQYLTAYEKFLLLHYTGRFSDYSGGTFKINNTQDNGEGEYTVSMTLQGDKKDSEPVLVDYRLRKDGGSFKIFDVIVEGVSLITTQRSEFSAVIADHDIDFLIKQLETKSIPVSN